MTLTEVWLLIAQFFAAFNFLYRIRECYDFKKNCRYNVFSDEESFKIFYSDILDVMKGLFFIWIIMMPIEAICHWNPIDVKFIFICTLILAVRYFMLALITIFLAVTMMLFNILSIRCEDKTLPEKYKDYPIVSNILKDIPTAFVALTCILKIVSAI